MFQKTMLHQERCSLEFEMSWVMLKASSWEMLKARKMSRKCTMLLQDARFETIVPLWMFQQLVSNEMFEFKMRSCCPAKKEDVKRR